ncbi:MAG: iron-sulfur cluster assembly protein [Sulfolobaceae archaeon]
MGNSIMKVLEEIIDPEANHSIVELGLVEEIREEANKVRIVISPPTYWCSPLILYLIMEEIKERISNSIIEVRNHHDAEKLTRCINGSKSFEECYSEEVEGGNYTLTKKLLLDRSVKKDRLTRLSLGVTGELCRLLSMVRRNESSKTT